MDYSHRHARPSRGTSIAARGRSARAAGQDGLAGSTTQARLGVRSGRATSITRTHSRTHFVPVGYTQSPPSMPPEGSCATPLAMNTKPRPTGSAGGRPPSRQEFQHVSDHGVRSTAFSSGAAALRLPTTIRGPAAPPQHPPPPLRTVYGKGLPSYPTASRIRSICRMCSRSWPAYSRIMCARLSSPRSA